MSINPLIEATKIPGQTVRLPSKGIFYDNGELNENVKNGEVHVFPMTAYHEILLKSPDFLMNGMAVERVLRDCVPEINNPLELITKDIDFLMLCLRKVTFGDQVDFNYTHTCDDAQKHNYVISLSEIISKTVGIDPTKIKDDFNVVISTNAVITAKPLTFGDFIKINSIPASSLKTPDEQYFYQIKNLMSIIKHVEHPTIGIVEDKQIIEEWMKTVSADDIKNLTNKINESGKWGPQYETTCTCKDCGTKFPVELPFNPVLFFS